MAENLENKPEYEYDDFGKIKPKKLQPEWENAPTVGDLKKDVREAEPDFNSHVADVKNWLDARDGILKVKIPKGKSKVTPKLIRKQNEWTYAALSEPFLVGEDLFDVEPKTYEDKEGAVANATILNKQFRQDIDRVEFIDKYIRTGVDEGLAFLRVGWEFEEQEVMRKRNVISMQPTQEMQMQLMQAQQAVQAGQMDPQQFQQMIQQVQANLHPVVTGQEEVPVMETVKNQPTIEVCDYDKVSIDPTCEGDLDKARFMSYKFVSSKSELKVDPKYSNVEAIDIESNNEDIMSASDDSVVNGTFEFDDKPRKQFTVIEYWGDWDIHGDGTTYPIVAAWVGDVMIRLEENPFPDRKPPFVMVPYLPKRRAVYPGEPYAVLIEDHQDVIGAVTRGMIDLMAKSANAQQGISADALDPAQRLRFEQGKDYIFNPGIDPTKAFFMGAYPEIPKSAMEMITFQDSQAESLSGRKGFAQGISGSSLGDTATGVRSAMDATAKRETGILRRFADGLIQAGEKIMAMNAVNLDDEEVIRITNDEYVAINRDDLSGDYDLELSISTPEKDQEKAQDLAFMLQTIGPNMDPGLQKLILSDIADLKDMPVLKKKIMEFEPQPDPMQEKMKELQVQLLEAQVANELAQSKENQADAANKGAQVGLNEAKTQTELAKARSLDSTSDIADLDFLQKKDGTQHKQNMEAEDKRNSNATKQKGIDYLLNPETSNQRIGQPLHNPNTEQGGSKNYKPEDVLGMNTPQENTYDDKNVRV